MRRLERLYIVKATTGLKSKILSIRSWFTHNKDRIEIVLFYVVAATLFREILKAVFGLELPLRHELVVMWLIIIYLFKLKGSASIYLFIVLIVISVFFLSFDATGLADQGANLAYLLAAVGISQYFLQLFRG